MRFAIGSLATLATLGSCRNDEGHNGNHDRGDGKNNLSGSKTMKLSSPILDAQVFDGTRSKVLRNRNNPTETNSHPARENDHLSASPDFGIFNSSKDRVDNKDRFNNFHQGAYSTDHTTYNHSRNKEYRKLQKRNDCITSCPNGRPVIGVNGNDFWAQITTCISYYDNTDCNYSLPLNCWDTSGITNMSRTYTYDMYYGGVSEEEYFFDENIDCWNTSSVTSMRGMFRATRYFNQPIGDWDVSSVTDMHRMFEYNNYFDQPIGDWDVSKVTDTSYMFYHNEVFNQPIGDWDVSGVENMVGMFLYGNKFNQPIGDWDVSNVTNMYGMFLGGEIFYATRFNQPIGDWNVSKVTNMGLMFKGTSHFNQPIQNWDVSSVTTMDGMFMYSFFNQPIGDWNVSSVKEMGSMFQNNRVFNLPIGDWDVSSVTEMYDMFRYSAFNQPIGNWNVSSVVTMYKMFYKNVDFNQPIDGWDVSSVTSMNLMFESAETFNQCLGSWGSKTPSSVVVNDMFVLTDCPGSWEPNPNRGPWCQTSEESCGTLCTNKSSFKSEGKRMTCEELQDLGKKKRKKMCRKKRVGKACPGVCNTRCVCKDRVKFRIKKNENHDFKGKYKCKNVGKDEKQPSCETESKKRRLVKDLCPEKCGYCLA